MKIKSLFYRRLRPWFQSPSWMQRAYYDAAYDEVVFVIFPLSTVVSWLWKLNLAWSQFRSKPSWVEEEVEARIRRRMEEIRQFQSTPTIQKYTRARR